LAVSEHVAANYCSLTSHIACMLMLSVMMGTHSQHIPAHLRALVPNRLWTMVFIRHAGPWTGCGSTWLGRWARSTTARRHCSGSPTSPCSSGACAVMVSRHGISYYWLALQHVRHQPHAGTLQPATRAEAGSKVQHLTKHLRRNAAEVIVQSLCQFIVRHGTSCTPLPHSEMVCLKTLTHLVAGNHGTVA